MPRKIPFFIPFQTTSNNNFVSNPSPAVSSQPASSSYGAAAGGGTPVYTTNSNSAFNPSQQFVPANAVVAQTNQQQSLPASQAEDSYGRPQVNFFAKNVLLNGLFFQNVGNCWLNVLFLHR